MNKNDNSRISSGEWEAIKRIPSCRYLKDPVATINDLYIRYPDGGEYGWYAYVENRNYFAVWDREERKWKPVEKSDRQYSVFTSVNHPSYGSIHPEGINYVQNGEDFKITISSRQNYILGHLDINGSKIIPDSDIYVIQDVHENISLKAVFMQNTSADKMYYGWLKQQDTCEPLTDYSQITKQMLDNSASVTSGLPSAKGKISMGNIPAGVYIIIATPADSGLEVKKDNGMGGKTLFDTSLLGANELTVKFDGIYYRLSGELSLISGERFIYIN